MSTDSPRAIPDDLLDLIVLFRRFYQKAQRYEQSGLHHKGMSPARVNLLCELLEHGSVPMNSLASALFIAPRSVTSLVDGLEREGIVERIPNPRDRRSTLVSLTKSGRKEALVLGPANREHMASLFGTLPDDEIKLVVDVLRKLMAEIDDRANEA